MSPYCHDNRPKQNTSIDLLINYCNSCFIFLPNEHSQLWHSLLVKCTMLSTVSRQHTWDLSKYKKGNNSQIHLCGVISVPVNLPKQTKTSLNFQCDKNLLTTVFTFRLALPSPHYKVLFSARLN